MTIDLTSIVAAIREHAGALNNLAAAIREGGPVTAADVSTDAESTKSEGTKPEGTRKRRTKAEIAADEKAAADKLAAEQNAAMQAALAAAAANPAGQVVPPVAGIPAMASLPAVDAQSAADAVAAAQAALAAAAPPVAAPVSDPQADFDKLRATMTGWAKDASVIGAIKSACDRFALGLPLSVPGNPEVPGSAYASASPAVRLHLQAALEDAINKARAAAQQQATVTL